MVDNIQKKNEENGIKSNASIKKSSLASRLRTAAIVLPILFALLTYPFLYFILTILVIYVSYKEYCNISAHIFKNIFSDQFSDSTVSALLSSSLQAYIILLLPILNYGYKDSELFVTFFVLMLLLILRISNFINIYRLYNTKGFDNQNNFQIGKEFKEPIIENENKNGIKKIKNPNPLTLNMLEKMNKNLNLKKTNLENAKSISEQLFQKDNISKETSANREENYSKSTKKRTITSFKNSQTKQYITEKMFNACLITIELDFIFVFIYAVPICYGISLHHKGVGLEYITLTVMIAYTCDAGALFSGMKFGKTNFGAPITPTKTIEGIYGGITFALFSCIVYRFVLVSLLHRKFFDIKIYILFIILQLFTSIFGDLFESFLKRCGNIKDSGAIFPGHGGLLDRIDSITLGLPVCYFFVKKYLYC